MSFDRRSLLKLFGVTAGAATVGVTVTKAVAVPELAKAVLHPSVTPLPPDGMTYQWKRIFITADEPDLENILKMAANGWKPVPIARHRHEYPDAPIGGYWIEHGGVVLMEKPTKDIPLPQAHPTPGDTYAGAVTFDGNGEEWMLTDVDRADD